MYKTSRLVRISLLIMALNKRVLLFSRESYFIKAKENFLSCVCISWYKRSIGWENSRQLCKPSTSSRVCLTVSNSPNPSRVYIRLCKHGKRFLLLKKNLRTRALKRWHKKGNYTAVLHQLKSSIQNMWTNFLNEDKENSVSVSSTTIYVIASPLLIRLKTFALAPVFKALDKDKY